MNNHLLYEVEFKSNGKFNVKLFENRIEITAKGKSNFFTKGTSGTVIIYLKKLTALEFKKSNVTTGYIEFLTDGFMHTSRTIQKVQQDNIITFHNKEYDVAKQLVDMINELI